MRMILGEIIWPFQINPSIFVSSRRLTILPPIRQIILIDNLIRIKSLILYLQYPYPRRSIRWLLQFLPYCLIDLLHLLQLIRLQNTTQLQLRYLLRRLRNPQCSLLLSATLSNHLLIFMHLNYPIYYNTNKQMRSNFPSKTILAASGSNQEALNADHPLFYTKQRSHYLERLTQKINVQTQLPTVDLRRNMRIDYFMNQYNHIKQQHQKQVRIKNTMLHPSKFHSIFGSDEQKRRQQQHKKRQSRSIQQDLYKNYIQQANYYQPPQRDTLQESNKPTTILQLNNPTRMKEMYLIDLEIGKLRYEENLQKMVKERRESCQNNQLLGKLSSSIISSYMVYFQEIYQLLIDQILEDQVIYLNHMEASFKIQRSEERPKNSLEKRQTVEMMELVRGLEELCDD